jgi:hypothetical protein
MRIRIERLGGLAGMGAPQSAMRSFADIQLDHLAPADRHALQSVLERAPRKAAAGQRRDAFTYRITREGAPAGEAFEAQGEEIPQAVLDRIETRLD